MTNTSVNPARSTATAVFVGGWAIQQLWLFWLAPVIGAAIAGFAYKAVLEGPVEEPPVTGRTRSGKGRRDKGKGRNGAILPSPFILLP